MYLDFSCLLLRVIVAVKSFPEELNFLLFGTWFHLSEGN